jgi:hypothetical protein
MFGERATPSAKVGTGKFTVGALSAAWAVSRARRSATALDVCLIGV